MEEINYMEEMAYQTSIWEKISMIVVKEWLVMWDQNNNPIQPPRFDHMIT